MFVDNLADNKVNLDTLPDDGTAPGKKGPDAKAGLDLDNFFQTMEQQVNGAIYDTEPSATPGDPLSVNLDPVEPPVSDPSVVSDPEPTSSEVEKLREELDNLKQRYSDSSAEAKRLADKTRQLEQYEDYIPILETMREDPGLISHVRSYLEGNETPTPVKQKLDLPEDFIFDGDEAVRDPGSPSGKVLQDMIERGVEHRLKTFTQAQKQEQAQRDQATRTQQSLDDFRTKMDMSADDFNEFVEFAKGRQLTLEDIYYLKNRENREKEIAKKAILEREKQLKKMQGVPASMASDGGYSEEVDENKAVFEAIKNVSDSQNIFGD